MKCKSCGKEIANGSAFCEFCGARVDGPAPSGQPFVFCPNCGKKCAAGEAYCDACGAKLQEKKKIPLALKILLVPGALLVIGMWAFVITHVLFGGFSFGGSQRKLLYIKDDELLMADLKRDKDPMEVTDDCLEEEDSVGMRSFSSRERFGQHGSYLYYFENYDPDDRIYDLYRVKTSQAGKDKKGERIASNVSRHEILDDGSILYFRQDQLYIYKKGDSEKYSKGTARGYWLDEKQKNLLWYEQEPGESERTYYFQDVDRKKDRQRLATTEGGFYHTKDLTRFYYLDEDRLFMVDQEGEKEEVERHVAAVDRLDPDSKKIYFLREDSLSWPYVDLIKGDKSSMTAGERTKMLDENFELQVYDMYCYDGGKDDPELLAENVSALTGMSSGKYTLYIGCPQPEECQVDWEEIKGYSDWDSVIWSKVTQVEPLMVYADGHSFNLRELNNSVYGGFEVCYPEDDKEFYIRLDDDDNKDGVIYRVSLSGSDFKTEKITDDVYGANLLFATSQGIYYGLSYTGEGYDLWFNDKMLVENACSSVPLDEKGTVAVLQDYSSKDGEADAYLYKGEDDQEMSDGVVYADCAEDGTVVMLRYYNQNRREGDLIYFNGKKLRVLDQDVTCFIPRDEGKFLRVN